MAQTIDNVLRLHAQPVIQEWIVSSSDDEVIRAAIPVPALPSLVEDLYNLSQRLIVEPENRELTSRLLRLRALPSLSAGALLGLQTLLLQGKRLMHAHIERHMGDRSEILQARHTLDLVFDRLLLGFTRLFQENSHGDGLHGEGQDVPEEELLSRADLFYNAFQHSTDGIVITDLKGNIHEVNQAFLKIFGYSYEEVIGRNTSLLRSPRTGDAFYREMWRAIITRGEWKGEIVNRRKDGSEVPVLLSITPVFLQGRKIGYMGVEIDISEKKRIENQLLKEKEFSESLIETANSLIVTLDLRGNIILFNRKCEEVTGYTKQEVMGRNWFALMIPASSRPGVQSVFHSLIQANLPSHHENSILTKSGEERLISWNNTVIRDEKHAIIGALAIGQDVTEQKNLQKQVIQTERLATIGKMAAKVAHEIRNPLSSISLNAELLQDEIQLAKDAISREAESMLQSIMGEVDRVAKLTEEYLQFSRLPEASPEPGDLVALVQEVLAFVENEANATGVEIIARYAPNLPTFVFDRQQIRRALLNLVRNALEAMPRGGMLRVEVTQAGRHMQLTVSDTGEGIPLKDGEKIFEPFYTTKDMGTGLGLAIVRQIVQEHGGTITFSSDAGVGATFHLHLPLDRSDLPERNQRQSPAAVQPEDVAAPASR